MPPKQTPKKILIISRSYAIIGLMNIKKEEIIFRGAKIKHLARAPQTVCEIFHYQPDNIEQMAMGNLYIVAELNSVKDCAHLNNLLASLIKREYYLYPQKGALKNFQVALKKANFYLNDMAKEGNLEWLGKFHFICASISDQDIYFAQAGNAKAFLCRQNHLTDFGKKVIPEPEKPSPSKIFSSVVSGKIAPGDKIIFATPQISEIFSAAGLRQMIVSNEALESISDQIQKILREHDQPPQLAILLLQAQKDEPNEQFTLPDKKRKMTTPPIDLKEILG